MYVQVYFKASTDHMPVQISILCAKDTAATNMNKVSSLIKEIQNIEKMLLNFSKFVFLQT